MKKYEYDLLAICLELHMHNSGASDPLLYARVSEIRATLIARYETWDPPIERFARFDNAVLALIEAVLAER